MDINHILTPLGTNGLLVDWTIGVVDSAILIGGVIGLFWLFRLSSTVTSLFEQMKSLNTNVRELSTATTQIALHDERFLGLKERVKTLERQIRSICDKLDFTRGEG